MFPSQQSMHTARHAENQTSSLAATAATVTEMPFQLSATHKHQTTNRSHLNDKHAFRKPPQRPRNVGTRVRQHRHPCPAAAAVGRPHSHPQTLTLTTSRQRVCRASVRCAVRLDSHDTTLCADDRPTRALDVRLRSPTSSAALPERPPTSKRMR